MVNDETSQLIQRKEMMRRRAYDARNSQRDKDQLSKQAIARMQELPEYSRAKTVMWYIDCRSELRTQWALPNAISSEKRIVVPYCTEDEQGQNKLGLWWLQSMNELVVGKWKILEPPQQRWGEGGKEIQPSELDFIVVPGVGFSRDGARMGNGQGYYDRLLERVRLDCHLVGVCYESQLFEDLVVGPHDVHMDIVVTESDIYYGKGRG